MSLRLAIVIAAVAAVVSLWLYEDQHVADNGAPLEMTGPDEPIQEKWPENSDSVSATTSSPDTKTITFPDGDVIEITFREAAPRNRADYKMDNVAASYPGLRAKAEAGDALAALALYDGLSICADISNRTDEEFAEAMSHVVQSQPYVNIDRWGNETLVEVTEWSARNLEINLKYCRGVTDELANEHMRWLWQAADLGHPQAMSQLGSSLGDSELGDQYLQRAFDDGYYDAANWLAAHLMNCNPARCETATSYEASDEDITLGYAYSYLYLKLIEVDPTIGSRRYLELLRKTLRQSGDRLSTRQVDEGVTLAKELLVNHPACCRYALERAP